ncbi:hypothetical protein ACHAQA_009811 [Verticillium albo-atrum]
MPRSHRHSSRRLAIYLEKISPKAARKFANFWADVRRTTKAQKHEIARLVALVCRLEPDTTAPRPPSTGSVIDIRKAIDDALLQTTPGVGADDALQSLMQIPSHVLKHKLESYDYTTNDIGCWLSTKASSHKDYIKDNYRNTLNPATGEKLNVQPYRHQTAIIADGRGAALKHAGRRGTHEMSSDQESGSDRESSPEQHNSLPRGGPAPNHDGAAANHPDESDSESIESNYAAPVLPTYNWQDPRVQNGVAEEDDDAQSQLSGDESDKSDYTPPKLPTFSSLNPPSYSDNDEDDANDEENEDDSNDEDMSQAAQIADRALNYVLRPVPSADELPEPVYSEEEEDRPADKHAILATTSKENSPEVANGYHDENRSARSASGDAEDFEDAIKRSSPTTPLSMLRKATKRKLTRNEKERRADKRRKVQTSQPDLSDDASGGDEDEEISGSEPEASPNIDERSVAESTPSRQLLEQQAAPATTSNADNYPTIDNEDGSNGDDGDEPIAAPAVEPVAEPIAEPLERVPARSTPASQKRKQRSKPTFSESAQKKPLRTYRTVKTAAKRSTHAEDEAVDGSGSNGETAASPAIKASSQAKKRTKVPSSARKKTKTVSSAFVNGDDDDEASMDDAAANGKKSTPNKSKQTPKADRKTKKPDDQSATPSSQPQNPLNRVYSKDDLLRITKAVDEFGTLHKLTRVEINDMIQQRFGTGRHSFNEVLDTLWNTIFATCPGKTRQKTIDYCRKNFHNYKARGGNWTAEEEEELAMLVAQNGKQWTKWSKNLNRHPEDIRDRYRNYVICGDSLDRSHWTDEEEQLLVGYVEAAREALRGPMRYRPVEQAIDWQKISDQFDRTRSRLQCLTKWKRLQA